VWKGERVCRKSERQLGDLVSNSSLELNPPPPTYIQPDPRAAALEYTNTHTPQNAQRKKNGAQKSTLPTQDGETENHKTDSDIGCRNCWWWMYVTPYSSCTTCEQPHSLLPQFRCAQITIAHKQRIRETLGY